MRRSIRTWLTVGLLSSLPAATFADASEALLFDATGEFASRDCRIRLSVFSFFDEAHVERLEGRIDAVFRDGRHQTRRFSARDLWPKASVLADPVLEFRRTNCRAIVYLRIRSLDICDVGGRLRDDCLERSAGSDSSSIPIRVSE